MDKKDNNPIYEMNNSNMSSEKNSFDVEIEKSKNEFLNSNRFQKEKSKTYKTSVEECNNIDEVIEFYYTYLKYTIVNDFDEKEYLKWLEKNKNYHLYNHGIPHIIGLELERLGYTEEYIRILENYVNSKIENEYQWTQEVQEKLADEFDEKCEDMTEKEYKENIDKMEKKYAAEYNKLNRPILDKLLSEVIENKDVIIKQYYTKRKNRNIKNFLTDTKVIGVIIIYIIFCFCFWQDYGFKTLFVAPIIMLVLWIFSLYGDAVGERTFGKRYKDMTPFEVSKEIKEYEVLNKMTKKNK